MEKSRELNLLASASASAPGRLDVMGGVADYSGSLLLQMPIKERTQVHIKCTPENEINIKSKSKSKQVYVPLNRIYNEGTWTSIAQLQTAVPQQESWCLYVLGCVYLFYKHYQFDPTGLEFEISSNVPIGKGVSSSASLEVAVLMSLAKLHQIAIEENILPHMAQQAENEVVGAPCGLMDQLAVFFGKSNHLLPLICQPAVVKTPLSIPKGIYFIGLDSGVKHAVSGNPYGDARTASFMAYSIIEQSIGASFHEIEDARIKGNLSNLKYKGYIANIDLYVFYEKYASLVPDIISGKDFKKQYGGLTDALSNIVDDSMYFPKNCGSHPIEENDRIQQFSALLKIIECSEENNELLSQAGSLMYASHEGYTKCGLGHKRTDEIVALAKKAGMDKGIFGARITGGGSGGTVCFMVNEQGKDTMNTIRLQLSEKYQQDLYLFEGSSEGANDS